MLYHLFYRRLLDRRLLDRRLLFYHHWIIPKSNTTLTRPYGSPSGQPSREFISVSRGIRSVFGVEPETILSPNGTENMLKLLNTTEEYGPSFFQQLETSAAVALLDRGRTPTPTPIKLQTDAAEGVIGARAWVVGEVVVSGLARRHTITNTKQKVSIQSDAGAI